MAQRVPVQRGAYQIEFEARSERDVGLHLEVCERHLLYPGNCAARALIVKSNQGARQRHELVLDARDLSVGPWYAPRLGFFAIAVTGAGQRVEIAKLRVSGPDGSDLLVNGDFGRGMARWFIVSERIHLPWHIKSIFLNLLFDQGMLGLLFFLLLTGGALWRLAVGRACRHPLAPCFAAAIAGFLVVGMFDSLLDVPRIAVLFYLMVLFALQLRDPRRSTGVPKSERR